MLRKIFRVSNYYRFVFIFIFSTSIYCAENVTPTSNTTTHIIFSNESTIATKKNETNIPKEVADLISNYTEQCSADFRNNLTSVEAAYLTKNYVEKTPSYENVLTELLEIDWKEEQQRRSSEKQMAKVKEEEKLKQMGRKPGTLKPSKKSKDKPKEQKTTPTMKVNKMDKFEEVNFKQKRTKGYYSNRSLQWKLFLWWLKESKDSITKERLKEFFEAYDSATNCGFTEGLFIDCVLNAWVNPSKITKLPPEVNVKKVYNSLVGITSKHKIESPCADLMSKIYEAWPGPNKETPTKDVL